MADEITVYAGLTVINGNFSQTENVQAKSFDQSAVGGGTPGTIKIGTLDEQITFTDIATLGWLKMTNLDEANYVQWGGSTGVYIGRLEPGEPALFRLDPGAALWMKANTAECSVRIETYED